jgi:cellulose synthase/poly-beta-1,6-N-acetylglucosamine synthase-like glycosyltransferase
MTLMEALLGCAALLLLVPVTVARGSLPALTSRDRETLEEGVRPRLAVLMPAHNEAPVIATSIRSVLPQLSPADRLLVVADNCSDETATVASAARAHIIVRSDTTRRGYGRRIVSLGDLVFSVVYALSKVPLYAKFIVARQLVWVRSKKDGEES